MNESLLTNENDNNVTKDTEGSLSLDNEPLKKEAFKNQIMNAITQNLLDIIKENAPYKNLISVDKFYLTCVPNISLNDYIKRLVIFTKMDISTLINAIIYIDTYCEKKNCILCLNNVYLILLSACLLSIKFNEDFPIDTKFYSQIAGIKLQSLINLESSLLASLDYRLLVKEDLYRSYYDYFSHFEISYPKKEKEI